MMIHARSRRMREISDGLAPVRAGLAPVVVGCALTSASCDGHPERLECGWRAELVSTGRLSTGPRQRRTLSPRMGGSHPARWQVQPCGGS